MRGWKNTWLQTMAAVTVKIPQHIAEHLVPLVPGKIDIDIRRIGPPGIEETLEVEIVLDRTDIGDIETIGDQRCRPGAAAADPPLFPPAVRPLAVDDVPHHQKIGGKAHLLDDPQFMFEAFDHRLAQIVAVPAPAPRDRPSPAAPPPPPGPPRPARAA